MSEMTSKERVLAAFRHEEPDRVPVDYSSNPGIDGRLKGHFGLAPDDGEGLLDALGVDFRGVGAPYVSSWCIEQWEDYSVVAPAARHNGKFNAVFVDSHVESGRMDELFVSRHFRR